MSNGWYPQCPNECDVVMDFDPDRSAFVCPICGSLLVCQDGDESGRFTIIPTQFVFEKDSPKIIHVEIVPDEPADLEKGKLF